MHKDVQPTFTVPLSADTNKPWRTVWLTKEKSMFFSSSSCMEFIATSTLKLIKQAQLEKCKQLYSSLVKRLCWGQTCKAGTETSLWQGDSNTGRDKKGQETKMFLVWQAKKKKKKTKQKAAKKTKHNPTESTKPVSSSLSLFLAEKHAPVLFQIWYRTGFGLMWINLNHSDTRGAKPSRGAKQSWLKTNSRNQLVTVHQKIPSNFLSQCLVRCPRQWFLLESQMPFCFWQHHLCLTQEQKPCKRQQEMTW